ncbi:MAG: 16S rRNA (adenine(1518)-N(6)/adenine(1519)-N(6))-dimethyltransferase RsmA [Erysipelotrichaceae bacterium]|nr:16S rRNA (adenine(1518)-N(6)/adenine(1519)-N(6))-dimethyltransferase RsmA [Erysipelotrichaceae bacterium]
MKDIAKKSNTIYLLNKYKLNANKCYGQNFIVDLNTIKKIVDSTSIDKNTCVIEIGPGIGALSEQLGYKAGKVICYEIDERLKPVLNESLGEFDNIEVIFKDFLEVDLKALVDTLDYDKVCVVANLPYYITSDLLESMITSNSGLSFICAMIQKEVAEKLVNKHTPLSYMIESVGRIDIKMNVSRHVFMPEPHVDSSIIEIQINSPYDDKLTNILKTAFTQKRKTIYNNLKALFNEETKNILEKENISLTLRPEQLSIDDYIHLSKYLGG